MDTRITTYTGVRFNLDKPDPRTIKVADIAHHLSMICRYTGAVREFYSVAQHSVLVSYMCDPDHALEGLFHDGSETYTNDISHFVKRAPWMKRFRPKENKIQRAVFVSIGLPANTHSEDVHVADGLVAGLEMMNLLNTPGRDKKKWIDQAKKADFSPISQFRPRDGFITWDQREAEDEFWHRYHQLNR